MLSGDTNKWINDNYFISFFLEYIESKHSQSKLLWKRGFVWVSTVEFRVQSMVSWERSIANSKRDTVGNQSLFVKQLSKFLIFKQNKTRFCKIMSWINDSGHAYKTLLSKVNCFLWQHYPFNHCKPKLNCRVFFSGNCLNMFFTLKIF